MILIMIFFFFYYWITSLLQNQVPTVHLVFGYKTQTVHNCNLFMSISLVKSKPVYLDFYKPLAEKRH